MAIAKKKPVRTQEKIVRDQLDLFYEQTNARYRIARAAYDAQDEDTQRVIDMLCDRLKTAGTGYVKIFPNGKRNPPVSIPITLEYQDMNVLYIATEILKDLALADVKVENYNFPRVYCDECGDRLDAGTKSKR
jgi:hypothetical protein